MAYPKLTLLTSDLPSSLGASLVQPQSMTNTAHTSKNPRSLIDKKADCWFLDLPVLSLSVELTDKLLNFHEHFHSRNLSVKCSFCTFTTKSTDLILNHIQLDHSEKKNKIFKVTYVDHKNNSPPKNAASPAKANGNVVPTKETNGIEGGNSKPTEDESKLWCICRQSVGNRFMVCCDGCKDWLHGSCVGITPAENKRMDADSVKWICPHCTRQNLIINHYAKVTQAMTSLSTEFQATSSQNSLLLRNVSIPPQQGGDSDEPPNFKKDNLSTNADEAPSSPPDLQHDRETLQKEEIICRMEMKKLIEEIRTAHKVLVTHANVLKENEGPAMLMSRARRTDELHRAMKEMEMKERGHSLEQSVLTEFKERAQQRLKELTSQKMELKRELKPLKEVIVNKKIKLELSSSNTSVIGELIQQKEADLTDVKVKLVEIEKEVNDFMARSGDLEKELAENSRNLALMRAELDSLKHIPAENGLPSADALQMKNLKKEQSFRIVELSRLKKRLVQISCGYVIDEINRKEEEALNYLDDYEKN